MSLGTKQVTVSKTQANDSVDLVNIPGDGGVGPSAIVIFAFNDPDGSLTPSDPFTTIQLFPSSHFTSGSDSNGNISVTATLVNSGDDKIYNIAGGGSFSFADGFWKGNVRAQLVSLIDSNITFFVQFSTLAPEDFTPDTSDPPDNVDASNISYDVDEDKGEVTISWDYDNHDSFDPVAFAVLRDGNFVASVPFDPLVTSYEFPDVVFNADGNTYEYTVAAYKYGPDTISPETPSVPVVFSGSTPNIDVTGSGGLDTGGAPAMVLIADASGIYTLTPDSRHDTIYDRSNTSTLNVEIPTPFFKTGFIGG